MLGAVLTRTSLDFKDLADLQEVDRQLRHSKLQLPRSDEFADLFGAFSWTIKTSLECGIRASNLSHATAQLKRVLERRVLENPIEISNLLAPLANVQFSIPPIKEFLEWAKVLLWRANVKTAFMEEEIDLATIEELVTVAPKQIEHYHEAFSEFTLVEGVMNKAKSWRKQSNQFNHNIESLFEITSPNALTTRIGQLISQLSYLRASYTKEDLKLIKNLNYNFEQLTHNEAVLGAVGNIAKMLKGELVYLNDFLTTIEIIEKNFKDDKKYSLLMHQFQKIQREVIPSLEQLNKTSNALGQQSITPKGMKMKEVLARQYLKVKVFDLDYHLERLTTRVILGDLGSKIKRHLTAFFQWEKEAKTIINDNSLKTLLSFTTMEEVSLLMKRSRELRRNLQSSNLQTDILPELICYSWSLKVVQFLKLKPLNLQDVKALIASYPQVPHHNENSDTQIVFPKYAKNMLSLLQKQVETARMFNKFFQRVKTSRPRHREIVALIQPLKTFRVVMDKKIKIAKDLIIQDEKIKEKIEKFLEKSKPRLEVVEGMVDTLNKEPIVFEMIINKMGDKVHKMKELIRLAKKKIAGEVEVGKTVKSKKRKSPKPQKTEAEKAAYRKKLLKAYKKLNICSPEFENLLREKKLDESLVARYENLLTKALPKFKEIEAFEMEIEIVNNFEWAANAKIALFKKKVSMLRDSFEDKIDVAIDIHDLKTLARDGFHLSENASLKTDINFVEDLLKKVERRLKMMYKETPLSKVRKLKKRMLNCIDITREITELKERLKAKEERELVRNKAKRKAKTSLTKREKEENAKPSKEELLKKKK